MSFFPKRIIFLVFLFLGYAYGQTSGNGTTATDSSCTITTNPDITGIGVRIAFYIQGFLGIVGPMFFNDEEKESSFRNTFYTSVALTISALVYGRTPGGVSLLDGLIVTFLIYMITMGATTNIFDLFLSRKTLKFAYLLHLVFTATYGLKVWVNVKTFGSTPGCNVNTAVKYVLFGKSIGATSKGLRGFSIASFAVVAACIPFIAAGLFVQGRGDKDDSSSDFEELRAVRWISTTVICSAWVFAVVTIEQILQRNGVSHEAAQWTFGQTFSLVLVIGPVIDLGAAIWRNIKGKDH